MHEPSATTWYKLHLGQKQQLAERSRGLCWRTIEHAVALTHALIAYLLTELHLWCCVLQPCLGGDGKTLMFVNINCEPASVKETLCSLRFAAKVNQCETGAKGGARKHITELPSDPSTRAAQAGPVEV